MKKHKIGPIVKRINLNDNQDAQKKQAENNLDQYESIIFELIRLTDKQILDRLKIKYPSLVKFIMALDLEPAENKEKKALGELPIANEQNFDLDSNLHSHEDIGDFQGLDGMDSNPEDS